MSPEEAAERFVASLNKALAEARKPTPEQIALTTAYLVLHFSLLWLGFNLFFPYFGLDPLSAPQAFGLWLLLRVYK